MEVWADGLYIVAVYQEGGNWEGGVDAVFLVSQEVSGSQCEYPQDYNKG